LEFIPGRWNTADIFTKGLPYPRFAECRREMGLVDIAEME
jgi:hypothetical protein